MSQKDSDEGFAELLNRLREGKHSQNDIKVLEERTHLYSTNAQVNDHSNTIYQAAHTQKAQIKCFDIVVGDMSANLKNEVKEKIPDDPTKTMGLIIQRCFDCCGRKI